MSVTCPVVSTIIRPGALNNTAQVRNVQNFLATFEKMNVTVTGKYDEATVRAVERFQRKYANVILTPWGATKPSGYIHITTAKKMNEIACGDKLSLDSGELNTINTYKSNLTRGLDIIDGETTDYSDSYPFEITNIGVYNFGFPTERDNDASTTTSKVPGKFFRFIRNLFR